jgi:hypothetical protein
MNEAELKAGNQQSKIGKPQAWSGFARILAQKNKTPRDSSTEERACAERMPGLPAGRGGSRKAFN